MPQKIKPSTFNEYLNFLEEVYEEINTINNKPLIGIIPRIGHFFIPEIVKFYLDKNIQAFYFDFDGRTPTQMYPYFIYLFKELNDYNVFDESFIHAINVNYGRTSKKSNVIDSKDILCFGYGIDSLGKASVKVGIPGIQKIDTSENRIRLFLKEDYGRYKVKTTELKDIYPSDTKISLKELKDVFFKDGRKRKYPNSKPVKIFNMEQLGLEAINIRDNIMEGTTEKYIDNKKHADEKDKGLIKGMEKEIKDLSKQKKLI